MAVCEVLERSRAILKALEERRKEEAHKQEHAGNEDEKGRVPPVNNDVEGYTRDEEERETRLEDGREVSGSTEATQNSNGGGRAEKESNENEPEEEEEDDLSGSRPRTSQNMSFTRPVCQYLEQAREFFPLFLSYSPYSYSSSSSSSPSGSSPSVSLSSSITLSSPSSRDVNKPSGGTEPTHPSSSRRTQIGGGGEGEAGGGGTHNQGTRKTNKEFTKCLENSKSARGNSEAERGEGDTGKGEGKKNEERGENGGKRGNTASPRLESRRHRRVCEYLDAASRRPGATPVCDFLASLNLGPEPRESGPVMDPSDAEHEKCDPTSVSPRPAEHTLQSNINQPYNLRPPEPNSVLEKTTLLPNTENEEYELTIISSRPAEYPLKPNSSLPGPDPKNLLEPTTQLSSQKNSHTKMLSYPSCPKHSPWEPTCYKSAVPSGGTPQPPGLPKDLPDPRHNPQQPARDQLALRLNFSPAGTIDCRRTSPRDPSASVSSRDGQDSARTNIHSQAVVSSLSADVCKRGSSGIRCGYLRRCSPITTTTTTATTTTFITTTDKANTTAASAPVNVSVTSSTPSPTVLTCQYLQRSPPAITTTPSTTSSTPTSPKCPYLQKTRCITAITTPTASIINTGSPLAASSIVTTATTLSTISSSMKCSYPPATITPSATITNTGSPFAATSSTTTAGTFSTNASPKCPYLQAVTTTTTTTTNTTVSSYAAPNTTTTTTTVINTSSSFKCSYLQAVTTTTTITNTTVSSYSASNTATPPPTFSPTSSPKCPYLQAVTTTTINNTTANSYAASNTTTPATTFSTTASPKCLYLQAVTTTTITNTTANSYAASNTATSATTFSTTASPKCPYLQAVTTTTTTTTTTSASDKVTNNSAAQCPYLELARHSGTSTSAATTTAATVTSNEGNSENITCEYLQRSASKSSNGSGVICQYLLNIQTSSTTTTTTTTSKTTDTITKSSTTSTTSSNSNKNKSINNNHRYDYPSSTTTTLPTTTTTAENHNTAQHDTLRNNRQRSKRTQDKSRSSHMEGKRLKQECHTVMPGRGSGGTVCITAPQTSSRVLHGSTLVSGLGTARTNGRIGQLLEKSNISGEPADEGRVNILPLEARGGGRSANSGHLEQSPIESFAAHRIRPETPREWRPRCDYLSPFATTTTTTAAAAAASENINNSLQVTSSTSKQKCRTSDRNAFEINHTQTSFPFSPSSPFSSAAPRLEPTGASGHSSPQTGQPIYFIPKDGSTVRTFQKNTSEQQEKAPNHHSNIVSKGDPEGNGNLSKGRLAQNCVNGRLNTGGARKSKTRDAPDKDAVLDSSSLPVGENECVDSLGGSSVTCFYLHTASDATLKTSRPTCAFLEKTHKCNDRSSEPARGREEIEGGKYEKEGEQGSLGQNRTCIDDNEAPTSAAENIGDAAKFVNQSRQKFYKSRLPYQDVSGPVLTHFNGSSNSLHANSGRKGVAGPAPPPAARGRTPQPSMRASIKLPDRGLRADPGSVHAPPCGGIFRGTRCHTYSPTLLHSKFSIHRPTERESDERHLSPSASLASWEVLKIPPGPCAGHGEDGRNKEEEEVGEEEEELSDTSGSAALEEYDPRLSLTLTRSVSSSPSDDTRINDLELPPPEGTREAGAAPAKNEHKSCKINRKNSPQPLTPDGFQRSKESFKDEIYQNFDRNQDSLTASKLQRSESQLSGGVRGPRKADPSTTREGRDGVAPVNHGEKPAASPTTRPGAKTCGFLLRVQEVLRSLPGPEAALTTAAPETVTGGDK